MKSRLIQLSRGNVEYRVPEVRFGVEKLSGILLPDRKAAYEVSVNSENGVPMHLFFYSQNPRIKVSQPLSIGKTGKFTVEINTYGLAADDRILGSIDIVFNGGETTLPYDFVIGVSCGDRVREGFLTIDEFYELAVKNPKEAASIFAWREFSRMPFMNTLKMQGLYDTYMTAGNEEAGMREFLAACGMPLPVTEKPVKEAPEKAKDQSDPASSIYQRDRERRIRITRLISRFEVLRNHGQIPAPIDFPAAFKKLCEDYPTDTDAYLARAWYLTVSRDYEEARKALLRIQDTVQKDRLTKKDHYCLFMKLVSMIQNEDSRAEQCRDLTHRLFMDGSRTGLMFELEYRMNPLYSEETDKAAQILLQYYTIANRDPMVLLETCLLWEKDTSAITVLTEYELKAALYGLRFGLLSEKTLFGVFSHELKNPKLLNLYMLILKLAYKKFRNQEFLQAICNVYLQRKNIGRRYFPWYADAVSLNLAMPGLYEYYMASLPKDFDEPLPMNLVLYFGYGRESSSIPLELLYANVVKFYREDEKVWDIYRDKIEAYAVKKLRMEEFTTALLPVLTTILDREHLTPENAQGMISILKLRRIRTALPGVRRIVVNYPQLKQESSFIVNGEEALAPVYSSQAVIAAEDRYGVRRYDGRLAVSRVFEEEELEAECASMLSERLLLQLGEADHIAPGKLKEKDLFLVTSLIKNKKVDNFYRARLYEALVDLSLTPGMQHVNCCEFLLEADFASFLPEYRNKLVT
ncbi:MAG: hypothetical protein IKR59_01530, partial [Lachnospiraceae bacterium]|nr:hypothetical protein [Lachnospiraceae bacterium]